MDDLESQRHKLLKLYGFEADREGLIACIQSCDQNDILSQRYQQFEQALMKLQHSIQLNSLLVNKSQKRVRQSLHLLTGQAVPDNARTYSSSGLTQDLSGGRKIAQA
jgi:flagellar biosynthesis/type III secretory pathway chaperone